MDKRYFWGKVTSLTHPLPSWLVSHFVSHITLCPLYPKPSTEVCTESRKASRSVCGCVTAWREIATHLEAECARNCLQGVSWRVGLAMEGWQPCRLVWLQAPHLMQSERRIFRGQLLYYLFIYFLVHQCIRLITGLLTRKFSNLRVYLLQLFIWLFF